ncbi:eukaryotic translation initiation factor 2-alpha kinase isoform X2 [Harpegnathos saltator]|uniref:eukaryotic translation initiation factor 2-alpha kinase isoform X2 n=1 Tax=Harpegnathos saltator TaxID=610380 RepID=UPI00058E4D44|nr:eukaryotic translation initiation factor 2-alpha kinase isoform X2 [Harpegnathos saltator]
MFHVPVSQRVLFHYWGIFAIFCCFFVTADDTAKTKQLTLCAQQSDNLRSLIFVSTLDGKVSALDAANNGQEQWTLDFNNGPMLSSNIHSRELNDNGQWVRLIPSLNGGMYKFDGENLELLPITTDKLLHSSFRYSNDLVFSGGKEVHSYGVHTKTGKILYKCDITGCINNTDDKGYLQQEVLVIKRLQQTVRAVEARTGIERWNFSVGQHDLVLIPPAQIYCPDKVSLLNVQIKAIIPEGLIWAINESDPTNKLWQYKFDSPIVSIWREKEDKDSTNQDILEEINLFDSSPWIWGSDYTTSSPDIYVGMHQRQLYVQENVKFKDSLDSSFKHVQPKIYPWLPYPAVGTATNILPDKNDNREVSTTISEVQWNGFYLYPANEIKSTFVEQPNNSELAANTKKFILNHIEEDNEPVQTIQRIILSKWQEILVILLIILLSLTPQWGIFIRKNTIIPPVILATPIAEIKMDIKVTDENENADNYESRYLKDFEPVDCLGKGGYGVVFEAKNKIDYCNYAIKRISIPNNENAKERAMREVRALAKLDHSNIVRYFNTWTECPPSGWQEQHDKQWALKLSSSGCPSLISETETKPKDSVCIDVPQIDSPSVESAYEAYELDKIATTTNDSVVTFERSGGTQRDDAIDIGNCSDSSDASLSENAAKNSPFIDNSNRSESIVFEGSDNNIATQETDDSVTEESDNSVTEETDSNSTNKKRIRDRRKAALSLQLAVKSNASKTRTFLYIQMQLCQRLSLKEWLKQNSSVRDPLRVLSIFQQIVDAVEYIHLQGLIHRDLKPSNIFFALNDSIKVGDFGLATTMTKDYDGTRTPVSDNETVDGSPMDSIHTACVGTHLYMSPEQANGKTYDYKVDIYSLGIIYFELLTPFSTDMERAMVLTDLRKSIFPSNFAEQHAAEYDLLKMMLDEDPAKRPTAIGIKARPPLLNYQAVNKLHINEDLKSHFELPRRTRHSSN